MIEGSINTVKPKNQMELVIMEPSFRSVGNELLTKICKNLRNLLKNIEELQGFLDVYKKT